MQKELEKIGLSPNEAKVYLALIKLGQTPTGAIIKKTGLHRNIVYECLDGLVRQKLASEFISGKKKNWQPTNPNFLISQAEDYYNSVIKIVDQINKKRSVQAPEIIVYEGKEGFQTAYRNLMNRIEKNKNEYVLGAGGDKWVDALGNYYIEFEKARKEKNMRIHMIAYEWQRPEIVAHQSRILYQVKYLPEKYDIPANTEIHADGVFLQIFTDPVILIEIRSEEVAKGYLQHFKTLWKIARR